MSVIYKNENCFLLCHKFSIDQIYENKRTLDGKSYEINGDIFNINTIYQRENENTDKSDEKRQKKINNKKSKKIIEQNQDVYSVIQKIAERTEKFIELCLNNGKIQKSSSSSKDIGINNNNYEARQLSRSINSTNNNNQLHQQTIYGENKLNCLQTTILNDELYLIPPNCKFYQNNISNLSQLINGDEFFDFIVIDPPWWNKYIRRVNHVNKQMSYEMLDSKDILNIPIEKLVRPNGGATLVAIWCTNSPTHLTFIKNELLPKWNLRLLQTCYWIKITKYGETICKFDLPLKKQPYEHLILACNEDELLKFDKLKSIKYLFSIPSSIHSHKPPLIDLFREYLPVNPKCLEVFARYLMPEFTSIGLEVLKLQNLKLFIEKC